MPSFWLILDDSDDLSSWEGRMAARARVRRGHLPFTVYDGDDEITLAEYRLRHPEQYDPQRPVGLCECYDWRPFPPGQEHFGYAAFHLEPRFVCDHAHHDGEIWLGMKAGA
jgi:hypothetical protein